MDRQSARNADYALPVYGEFTAIEQHITAKFWASASLRHLAAARDQWLPDVVGPAMCVVWRAYSVAASLRSRVSCNPPAASQDHVIAGR
jgi:hypothetical protein